MTEPIPLFVELCAGTAALSLRLHRDGARPPVSRMGAKTGYADAILRILGLAPGQGARAYLWCEPDPGVRLLLHAYRSAPLARAAAAIIRGWAAEDPRALWERLRAEGPPRLPDGGAEAGEVARWAHLHGVGVNGKGPEAGFGGWERPFKQDGVTVSVLRQAGHPDVLGPALSVLPTLPATVTPDARDVDPREVARWAFVAGGSMMGDGSGVFAGNLLGWTGTDHGAGAKAPLSERLPRALDRVHDVPATITPDARDIDPPALPPGTIVYADPPYQNTTPYANDLPRSEVVMLARRWAAAGAVVAISEAEPIPELVADGWYAVEITGERIGQARTFSKQKREWVTLNRPPAWVPPVQGSLF